MFFSFLTLCAACVGIFGIVMVLYTYLENRLIRRRREASLAKRKDIPL